jgi:hypothetical protein
LSRGCRRGAVLVLLCLLGPFAPARAEGYQDVITKAFPGFQILSRSEFVAGVQAVTKGNPGLITGRFNDDEVMDFAAFIRDRIKHPSQGTTREHYLGKTVVCHGSGGGRYRCQVLDELTIFLPYESYLYRVGPEKIVCTDDRGSDVDVWIKRDAIGYAFELNAGGVYIHKPDGTYRNCAGD